MICLDRQETVAGCKILSGSARHLSLQGTTSWKKKMPQLQLQIQIQLDISFCQKGNHLGKEYATSRTIFNQMLNRKEFQGGGKML